MVWMKSWPASFFSSPVGSIAGCISTESGLESRVVRSIFVKILLQMSMAGISLNVEGDQSESELSLNSLLNKLSTAVILSMLVLKISLLS